MEKQTTQSSRKTTLDQNEIAARAYQIWEVAGHPAGCEISHWLQAEDELRAAQNPKAGQASLKPLQMATGQSPEHRTTETAKAQPRRQEAPVQSSRRGKEQAEAA